VKNAVCVHVVICFRFTIMSACGGQVACSFLVWQEADGEQSSIVISFCLICSELASFEIQKCKN